MSSGSKSKQLSTNIKEVTNQPIVLPSDIVALGNPLIKSWKNKSFTTQELRFLLISIVQLQKIDRKNKFSDSNNETYPRDYSISLAGSMHVQQFADFFGLKISGVYHELKKIAVSLTENSVYLEDSDGKSWIPLFSKIKYNTRLTCVEWEYNHNLKPYIIDLEENFTKYKLNSVIHFTSTYAIQLYQLLKTSIVFRSEITYDIVELKKILGLIDINSDGKVVEEKFKKINDFKKRVLESSCEIMSNNQYCDIQFEYTLLCVDSAKKYNRIKFSIWYKEKEKDLLSDDLNGSPVYKFTPNPQHNKQSKLSETTIRKKLDQLKTIPFILDKVKSVEKILDSEGLNLENKELLELLMCLGLG